MLCMSITDLLTMITYTILFLWIKRIFYLLRMCSLINCVIYLMNKKLKIYFNFFLFSHLLPVLFLFVVSTYIFLTRCNINYFYPAYILFIYILKETIIKRVNISEYHINNTDTFCTFIIQTNKYNNIYKLIYAK